MATRRTTTIDALPTELLAHVFGLFDGRAPSESQLHDQPETDMLKRPDEIDLKNISAVSKLWRAIALPMLFRHVVWNLDPYRLRAEPAGVADPIDAIPLLAFLRTNDLGRYVCSLTMLVRNRLLPSLDLRMLGSGPQSPGATAPHLDPDAEPSRGRSLHSIASLDATYDQDNNWLWDGLFGVMDPLRLTIIASPQMLASLLSCMLFVGDADVFSKRQMLHILSLSRLSRSAKADPKAPGPSPSEPPSRRTNSACGERRRKPSALFTIRPWTHLVLNEGSSIRVYKNYEFFLRRPPSILGALLGSEEPPNDVVLIPPTITSLSYIAIFPLSPHFSVLVSNLPRIEHLFVQLVPRNDVLLDPDEMRHVHASDLWMERNTCYGLAAGHTSHPRRPAAYNWRFLRVFESGDAADTEAWELAVEYLQVARTRWRVERDGLLVKGPEPGPEESHAAATDGAESDESGLDALDGDDHATETEILSVPPESFSPW
ncbi:hypothetical protein BT67DRAFT_368358 [Trichocladium antarcticum]|uniref:F-box domain-containing protein n=1 Tax=Trichocladium antarcticum TaxID=1450529 RepID=A0AAN6UTK3_9PEZI|nr:hypothetical protein BT67DRAFT_368358 [Trichocladium antarcticum]